MHSASGFVQGIDCLIGQEPIGNVPNGQGYAGRQGFVGVRNVMMLLVLRLEVLQDLQGNLWARGVHQNFLKPALKRSVLLDVLTVLVKGGRSNALNFSSG